MTWVCGENAGMCDSHVMTSYPRITEVTFQDFVLNSLISRVRFSPAFPFLFEFQLRTTVLPQGVGRACGVVILSLSWFAS